MKPKRDKTKNQFKLKCEKHGESMPHLISGQSLHSHPWLPFLQQTSLIIDGGVRQRGLVSGGRVLQ